jgi:hypothetical protein
MFLHSVFTYLQLVLEAFMADRCVSEEKLIQFTMFYMLKDTATWWAERCLLAVPFPFLTWARFKAKFCL